MALLSRKQSIASEDWDVLTGHGKLMRRVPAEMSRSEQWKSLSYAMNAWLEVISFRPGVRVARGARAEFALSISRYDFSQLLAVLGLELLFQITRTKRLLTCFGCGSPYIPERLPTRGVRTYCQGCGKRAAQRDAAACWRKRNQDYFRQRRSTPKKSL
jgi:hypothetical protein